MKSLKSFLAGVLAVSMLASNVNVGFTASNNFSDVDESYQSAVGKLTSVGVVKGYEDGTFRPEGTITRAEAAAIMVRMLGKEKSASYSVGMTQFSDTQGHWATGYINLATAEGIIKGYPDGTFKPENKVSYAEMITMMVRAIGAGEAVGARGTWPDNYLMFASAQDLTDGVGFSKNAPATRGDVAKIAENTLDAPMWEIAGYNTDGTLEIKEVEDKTETLLTQKLEITKYEEYTITKELGEGALEINEFEAGKDADDPADGIQADEKKNFEFEDNMSETVTNGEVVDIWANEDGKVIMVMHNEDTDQEIVRFSDVTEVGATSIEVKLQNGKTKDYDLAGAVNYKKDGAAAVKADLDEDKNLMGNLLLNDDNEITDINVIEFTKSFVVEEVDYDKDDNELKIKADSDMPKTESSLLYQLDDDVVYAYDENGMEIDIKSVEEGEMILYTGTNDEYVQIIEMNKVEGTVDGEDRDEIEVDGKEYKYNPNFDGGSLVDSIDVDDEVELYLDAEGEIVMLEKLAGSAKSGEYGIITEFYVYNDVEESENVAKIQLFDLASGEYTTRRVFDAEETDEQGVVFAGEDFFDGTDAKTDAELAGTYQGYVGKAVKYDIKSDKVVLYAIDATEYEEDLTGGADLDIDKDKFILATGNYYVENDSVKVYQATELDNNDLKIKEIEFKDLKDNTDMSDVVLVELDDDEEVAEYVFFPLDGGVKQSLNKSNDDNLGIVTRVRELSGEDYKVSVLTKDGEVDFYVNKDEADDITTTAFDGTSIQLDTEADWSKFEGLLVAYSTDSEGFVTSENLQISNKATKVKFYEVNGRNEVELINTSDAKLEKDAFSNMVVIEADMTEAAAVAATKTLVGDLVATADTAGIAGNALTVTIVETPAADLGGNSATIDVAKVGNDITITFQNDSNVAPETVTEADLIEAVEMTVGADTTNGVTVTVTNDISGDITLSATDDSTNAAAVAQSSLAGGLDGNLVLDNMSVSSESKIAEADEDITTYAAAHTDEANTVQYFLVEVDEDGDLVDLDGSDAAGTNVGAVGIMVFDPSEF